MAQPSYVAYYGLTTDPFSDLQEPPFIAVAGRQQAVDSVLHLLNYSDDLVFVTGPPGSGKSRLLDQLVRQVEPTIDLALLDVEEAGSEKEMLWELSSQLGLEPERSMSTEALQGLIIDHCRAQHTAGVIPTVAIDDIDTLPAEALSGLGALLHGGLRQQPGLRLIGLASDISEVRRETAALGFSAGQLIELPPLTFDDALHLVNGYFQSAGVRAGVPLEEADLMRLYRFSDGRPGAFIDAVRDHMLVAAQRRNRRIRLPWAHLLAGSAVAVVLTVAVLYQTRSGTGEEEAASQSSGMIEQPETSGGTGQPSTTTTADLFGTGDSESADNTGTAPSSPSSPSSTSPDSPAAEDRMDGSDDGAALAEMESIRERLDAALAERAAGDVEPGAGTTDSGAGRLSESGDADNAGNSDATAVSQPASNDATNSGESFAAMEPGLFQPEWLRDAPANSYTLQVVAARQESNVIQFAEASGLPMSELGYVVDQLEGQPWYVLLYGQYATSDAARDAINDLPERVRGTAPWPRTISGIREMMTADPTGG